MYNQSFFRRLGLGLSLGASVFMFLAAPKATAGNLSDVTGTNVTTNIAGNQSDTLDTIVTTSDLASAAFAPGNSSVKVGFSTPAVQTAVNQTAQGLNSGLASQTLPVVTPGSSASCITSSAQQILGRVVNDPKAVADQLEAGLMSNGYAGNPKAVRNLVSYLRGLTAGNQVNPAQLRLAVVAYNDLIKSSSNEYMIHPPQELLAVDSVLAHLVKATQKGEEISVQKGECAKAPKPVEIPVEKPQPIPTPRSETKPAVIIPQTW